MKSFRWTGILMVLVAGLALFTIFDFRKSEKQETEKEESQKALRLAQEDVNRVEISDRDQKIVLDKQADGWHLSAPLTDLADAQTMQSFFFSLSSEKIKETVVEGPKLDLATYGLASPVKTLKLQTVSGKSEEVRIGSVKAYDGNLYAQIDRDEKVYLLTSAWDALLSKQLKDFRDKRLLRQDIATANLQAIDFKSAVSAFRLKRSEQHWQMERGGIQYPVADDKVDGFLAALKTVRARDFLTDQKISGNLEQHHLKPARLEIQLFKDGAKAIFTLGIGALDQPKVAAQEPTAFAVSSDLKEIVDLLKSSVETLDKSPQDFYDRKKPFVFARADVEKIEVHLASGLKAAYEKTGDTWKLVSGGSADRQVESGKINTALDRLAKIEAVRILEALKKGDTPASLKGASQLMLFKKSGETVFDFQWGKSLTEKAGTEKPEAHYLPARTDRLDALLGVTEQDIQSLQLDTWLSEPKK